MNSPVPPPLGAVPSPAQATEPLAIASLVCGILSWVCVTGPITGIPAIICGHVARSRVERSGGVLGGAGMATAGLVLGYLSTFAGVVILVLFLVVGAAALPFAKQGLAMGMTKPNGLLLAGAVTQFKTEYRRLPLVEDGAKQDQRLENKALLDVLQARNTTANPRNVMFFETLPTSITNGELVDAWQTPFHIAVDADYDGRVKLEGLDVPGDAAVWSSGPNKQDEQGAGDDLPSWR